MNGRTYEWVLCGGCLYENKKINVRYITTLTIVNQLTLINIVI